MELVVPPGQSVEPPVYVVAQPVVVLADSGDSASESMKKLEEQVEAQQSVESPAAVSQSATAQVNQEQSDNTAMLPNVAASQSQAEEKHAQVEEKEEKRAEEKGENEDSVEAINARLRSFYQLDEQRQALFSSAASVPVHLSSSANSLVPIASLFSSFFSDPAVVATIRDNAALLTPLVASSFPVFLHQLCLLNPVLATHPLTVYTFSLSSLHPFTVCVHCSTSPVIGRLLYCRVCDVTLCGTCQQQGHHSIDHELTELAIREYRRDNLPANAVISPAVNSDDLANTVRLDDSGRVLEERKASDFAELSDRMRASGQRAWKQGAGGLRKVDEMLSQFATDIKRAIESMIDNVFSDAPKPSPPQAADEQKQQSSPRSRQQQQPASCVVHRPSCIGTSRINTAAPIDARESGIALAQPVRQSMSVEPRPQPQQQTQQQPQQSGSNFAYRAQLDAMGDMGLIKSAVDEQTCRELLTASKGDVNQAVQWLMDKINV